MEEMTREKVLEILEENWEYISVDGDDEFLEDLSEAMSYIQKNLK